MDFYDKKYGVDSDISAVQEFHKQRRMFAIKDGVLHIAPENVSYSHAQWFENKGWISKGKDELMGYLTRGFVDSVGVYFYKNYDFDFDAEAEKEVLGYLKELSEKLNLDLDLHLFGGLIKGEPWEKWSGKKDYGKLKDLIK